MRLIDQNYDEQIKSMINRLKVRSTDQKLGSTVKKLEPKKDPMPLDAI